ncbi:MAG: cytochrome c biogenesis protein CcdA [Ghiorsea sp.]
MLGQILGDVSSYWMLLPGLLLLWIAADMFGVIQCSLVPNSLLSKLKVRGAWGAFLLGLAYGVISGSCTFGFIAPILAVITVQQEVVTGMLLITLFALGHCLPIAIAGSSTAKIQYLLASASYERVYKISRIFSAVLIAGLSLYFIALAFR